MKETFYFSHDYEPTSDLKIGAMLTEYGAVGYGLFWRLVEILHSEQSHKIPHKKYVFLTLAKQMLTDVEQIKAFVKSCIEVYELFESDGEYFWSNRVLRNIEKRNEIKEKRANAGKASAEKRKEAKEATLQVTDVQQNSTSVEHNLTHDEQISTQSNKGKESKGKERKIKKNKEKDIKDIESLHFQYDPFLEKWGKWIEKRKEKKWSVKFDYLQGMAKKLDEFEVEFAMILLETATLNEYQGVVFDTTPAKYEQFLKSKSQNNGKPSKTYDPNDPFAIFKR